MSIIERIEIICERANLHLSLEAKRAESQRFAPLIDQARQSVEELTAQVEQVQLFENQGSSLNVPGTAVAAHKVLSRLRDRFAQNLRAEDLTRGRDWTLLKEKIRATRNDLDTALDSEWKHFVDSAYSGDNPDNISSVLAATDGNLSNLTEYRRIYSELKQSKRSRPQAPEDFKRIKELARKLAETHQQFDFSVPDEVNLFLQAVAAGGADLELLTETVREWLNNQDIADQYCVVSRTSE